MTKQHSTTTAPGHVSTCTRFRNAITAPMLALLCVSVFGAPGSAAAQSGFDPSANRVEVEVPGISTNGPAIFTAYAFTGGQINATDPATSTSSGSTVVRPVADDLSVTKSVDAFSAKLGGSCLLGRRFPYVKIRVYRYDAETETEVCTLEVTATDATIASHRTGTSSVRDPWTAAEQVTFKFVTVQWSYPEQGVSFTWNRRTYACTGC